MFNWLEFIRPIIIDNVATIALYNSRTQANRSDIKIETKLFFNYNKHQMASGRKVVPFEDYEGKIVDGIYKFPELFQLDKGRRRVWRITVRLVKRVVSRIYENDWNVLADVVVPIEPAWIVQSGVHLLPQGVDCQYWVETGFVDGKIVRHQPNFAEAKCVGRKNERSVLLQGMMDARSDWAKYVKKGYSLDGETRVSARPWPMLAQIYKKRYNKVEFPVLVQPKLNGVRCLAHKVDSERKYVGDIDLYTRSQTDWLGMPQFRTQLSHIPKDIVIDGEIYGRRSRLNEIQGWSSDESKSVNATLENTDIRYYIYDVFNPVAGGDWTCYQRMRMVGQLFGIEDEKFTGSFPIPAGCKSWDIITDESAIKEANKDLERHLRLKRDELNQPFDDMDEWEDCVNQINEIARSGIWRAKFTFVELGWLVRVPTILVRSKAELMIAYYTLLVAGYEGLMVRTINGKYSTSVTSNKTRSNDLMKFKPISDAEYPIIGFTCGSGRDQDALIWKCRAADREFDVVPKNMDMDERRALYKKFKDDVTYFNQHYMGKQMTVEYAEISEYGVPLQAKAIGLRID